MCWVALDRAVALADKLDASNRAEAWKKTGSQIREAILTKGWSDKANAFTQSFGSEELDASNLMLPLGGVSSRGRSQGAGHDQRDRRTTHR